MLRNTLLPLAAAVPLLAQTMLAQVNIVKEAGKIKVEIDGKPFTDFYIGPEVAKPYLHPLRSASGKIVTRRWPSDQNTGEVMDHPHHRGVFVGHDNVNHVNFWANEPEGRANDLGKVVLKEVSQAKGGKRSGTIVASFDWNDPKGKLVLSEKRTMTFYSDAALRIVDFDFLFIPNGKVVFGDSKEGFFAVRVNQGLQEEKSHGRMVNAEGAESEKNIWGKPSNWVDFQGEVEGEAMGMAMFDHPENPRHPERWHARGYGLFAVNPFCLAAFTKDKTQNGDYVLEADKTLRLRYRLAIHPGDAKSAKIAAMYESYAGMKK
jgi:hypothetical protein